MWKTERACLLILRARAGAGLCDCIPADSFLSLGSPFNTPPYTLDSPSHINRGWLDNLSLGIADIPLPYPDYLLNAVKSGHHPQNPYAERNSKMPPQNTQQFYGWLRARLAQKAYAEIGPVQPLNLAFFKHGALDLPYVIAVTDTAHVSNTPTELFQRVEQWFQQLHGHTGAGCLLFVYHSAPAVTTIEEIQKIGGYVTAGAHDLHTGRHWLSNHLGWEQEIYGE